MINSIKLTHSPIKSDYKEISNHSTMITVEKESKQEEKLYEKNKSGNMGNRFDRHRNGVGIKCFGSHRY